MNGMQLYDDHGQRKYLTPGERDAFLKAAEDAPREVRTFCATLVYTGCRITEALQLTADRVDLKGGVLVFESLKKRKDRGKGVLLWEWCRTTARSRVCEIMEAAGITGRHATPKGLRHAFGIKGVSSQVPLNMVQKWLGHADLATTAIYADAVGAEAKEIAQRMWG